MSADRCKDCRRGQPCKRHAAAHDTAAILAAVRRETRPYNAPGGVGAPVPLAGEHETPGTPRLGGLSGVWARLLRTGDGNE